MVSGFRFSVLEFTNSGSTGKFDSLLRFANFDRSLFGSRFRSWSLHFGVMVELEFWMVKKGRHGSGVVKPQCALAVPVLENWEFVSMN